MSPSKKNPESTEDKKRKKLEELKAQAKELGFELKHVPVERPVGRPTVYDPEFHPGSYLQLSAQGKTKAQICAAWDISRDTLHEWCRSQDKPELTDAIKRGDEARTAWFTQLAVGTAAGRVPGANATMQIFLMKNVCAADFRDKVDHTLSLDVEDMEFG